MTVFEDLCRRFERWEDLRDAPVWTVRKIIDPVTYSERKATWLVSALGAITRRRGKLDLDFLAGWRAEAARSWLESLPGVGPKVSAAVLNFSRLRMRTLVADTHHLRVAKRLGILPLSAKAERAYRMLMDQVPEAWTAKDLDDHNTLMKKHGQAVCRHANPVCSACSLRSLCPSVRRGAQRPKRRGHLH